VSENDDEDSNGRSSNYDRSVLEMGLEYDMYRMSWLSSMDFACSAARFLHTTVLETRSRSKIEA
jgi:hypothetical protein